MENIGQYWKSWNILGNFGKECRNMLKIAEICRIMQKHAEYFKKMEHFYHVTIFHHSIVFQCDLWNSLDIFGGYRVEFPAPPPMSLYKIDI